MRWQGRIPEDLVYDGGGGSEPFVLKHGGSSWWWSRRLSACSYIV